MNLSQLKPPAGAVKKPKRVGRGECSGHGKTSGKGHKGQKARSGAPIPPGFEGGQMPLYRRLPKRGFKNNNKVRYDVVNVSDLSQFAKNTLVDIGVLKSKGLVNQKATLIKILSGGELSVPLKIKAHKFSKDAEMKIKQAGGEIEVTA